MLLRDFIVEEIRRAGPMSFERYMELCLYHPQWGYYTAPTREHFGRDGDYYTSAQLGTLFARIMTHRFAAMREELGADFTIVEVGPGRGEFGREIAKHFPYIPIEHGAAWPERPIRGCIFCNEFFDALPVRAFLGDKEVLVTEHDGSLGWLGEPPDREFSPRAADWMRRFAATLEAGYVIAVDYGYRGRERERFPAGTLMTYRRHQASEDVFADPGDRDITAHVDFDLLAATPGLREVSYDPQSRYLMRIGIEEVVDGDLRTTLQLKNLLFGIGETMRVLEMRKD